MKKLSTFLIKLFIVVFHTTNISYAVDKNKIYTYFYDEPSNTAPPNTVNLSATLINMLTWLGYIIAICIVLVTSIQFLTANAQKKAQLKDKLWLIVLGVILVAGAVPIFNIIAGALYDVGRTI